MCGRPYVGLNRGQVFSARIRVLKSLAVTVNDNQQTESQEPVVSNISKIFLGNIPLTASETDIRSFVTAKLGLLPIEFIQVAMGKKSKAPRGFAFVKFKDSFSAHRAVEILDGSDFDGRKINCNLKDDSEPSATPIPYKRIIEHSVYLTNLEFSLIEEEIKNMCDDIVGPDLVKNIKMAVDIYTGNPRGFAYLEFVDAKSAAVAIRELHGLEVLGRILGCTQMVANTRKAQRY